MSSEPQTITPKIGYHCARTTIYKGWVNRFLPLPPPSSLHIAQRILLRMSDDILSLALPTTTLSCPNLKVGLVLGALVLCVCFARWRRSTNSRARLPPGPSSIPIIGSLFHYPSSYPWFKFTEWKHQFGRYFLLSAVWTGVVAEFPSLFQEKSSVFMD